MNSILEVRNLEKEYTAKGNRTKAVDGISFQVQKGEYVGIMGPSGSGKTTLLNCVSTVDQATGGNIFVKGKDITALDSKALAQFRREELGFIFQDFNLLDTLTGRENIALALAIRGTDPGRVDQRV